MTLEDAVAADAVAAAVVVAMDVHIPGNRARSVARLDMRCMAFLFRNIENNHLLTPKQTFLHLISISVNEI